MKGKPVEEGAITPEEKVAEDHEAVEEALADAVGGTVRMVPLVLIVRRQYKESGDLVIDPEEEVEEIAVQDFHTEPAHAGIRMNHTLNLGNYWSASVQVSFDVPCYREEHEAAFDFVSQTVAARMESEIETAKERAKELRQNRGPAKTLF